MMNQDPFAKDMWIVYWVRIYQILDAVQPYPDVLGFIVNQFVMLLVNNHKNINEVFQS